MSGFVKILAAVPHGMDAVKKAFEDTDKKMSDISAKLRTNLDSDFKSAQKTIDLFNKKTTENLDYVLGKTKEHQTAKAAIYTADQDAYVSTEEKKKKASEEAYKEIVDSAKNAKSEKEAVGKSGLQDELAILQQGLKNTALIDEDKTRLETDVNNVKKDLTKESSKAFLDALQLELKNAQLTSDQKIKIMQDALSADELDVEDRKHLASELANFEIDQANKKQKQLLDLGRGFATDYQAALKAMVDNAMFGDDGASKQIQNSLTGIIGGDAASFVAGSVGGIVVSGITSILSGIFGGNRVDDIQIQAQKSFQKMVDNTNAALDNIGKEKSAAQKQVDILNLLKGQVGGSSSVPAQFLESLGLSAGTTVDQGIVQVLGRLQGLSTADKEAKQKLLSDLLAQQKTWSDAQKAENDAKAKLAPLLDQMNYDLQHDIEVPKELAKKIDTLVSIRESQRSIENRFDIGDINNKIKELTGEIAPNSLVTLDDINNYLTVRKQISDAGGTPADLGGGNVQRFASGGIVKGASYSGDTTMVRTNAGEMILNPQEQSNLFNMIKSGSSGNGTITVQVMLDKKELGRAIVDLTNLRNAGLN